MAADHVNVNVFVCCDKVIEEAENHKKTIIGIFSNCHFAELPSRLAVPWFIFAKLSRVDPDSQVVTINVTHDETQGVVFAASIELKPHHPEDVDIIIPANSTTFTRPGKHVVTLNIDGTQVAHFVLNVSLRSLQIGGN